jgi:hypothetical protein
LGRLNKCAAISPRFDVALSDIEKWENNLLPSRQFGYLVLTTSYGIMDNKEAIKKHTGGKVIRINHEFSFFVQRHVHICFDDLFFWCVQILGFFY